jgi:ketosteroid isomerase-like protein
VTNLDVLREALAALARLDTDGMIARTHPSLSFELPYERNAVLDRDGFAAMVGGMIANFQRFEMTIVEVIETADPDRLVARYEGDCLSKDGAVAYRNSYLAIVDFTDGLISRWREYANPLLTQKMNRALGAVKL